jgi:hypothetical protein
MAADLQMRLFIVPTGVFTKPISLALVSATESTYSVTSVLRRFLAHTRGEVEVQAVQLPLTYELTVDTGEMSARGIKPTQLRIALWGGGSVAWAKQATAWDATRGVVSTTSTLLQNTALAAEVSSAARNVAYLPLAQQRPDRVSAPLPTLGSLEEHNS